MELRNLPSVDALAKSLETEHDLPGAIILSVAKRSVDEARTSIERGSAADPLALASARLDDIQAARPRTVINATGVLLHTNLGRASVPANAVHNGAAVALQPSNVELDIRTGRRSKRSDYLATVLPILTGAEAGFAVNNTAGALLLALAATAGKGGKVAVSRGELIEIGGSFRLPELMAASGAELVEVGTTNRTRLSDYESVAPTCDALLKVHPSNYRIDGFNESTSAADLAKLAAANGIPFIHDVGSGLIDEDAPWLGNGPHPWLAGEPGVIQAVRAGADLVLFSGDKLFGGPQAGIVVGTAKAVAMVASHPIARAVRLDGSSIAALSAVTETYLEHRALEIPFWAMASATIDEITLRAETVASDLPDVSVVEGNSVPGAGSVPGETIPTRLIRISRSADATWMALASAPTPVIAVRTEGAVLIDLRSVAPEHDKLVRSALQDTLT
jgi:L-seryl-tRNA(Ser) seleniumtransferase